MLEIDQYRWKSRLLLVFASAGDDPDFLSQQRMLEGREGELAAHETLVMHILDGALPNVASARERFRIEPGAFAVVLVEKDGSAPLASRTPVGIDRVLAMVAGVQERAI